MSISRPRGRCVQGRSGSSTAPTLSDSQMTTLRLHLLYPPSILALIVDIANISAHISFHDKYVDNVSSWESAPRHFNPPFLDDELAVLCRRLERFEFNYILGPSCHTERHSQMRAESIVSMLPVLKFFSLIVPYCVKLGLWSGSAGFRDNIYSTDEGMEHADAEIGAYDTCSQRCSKLRVLKSRSPFSFSVDPITLS
jgi:hypothetical protein